MLAKIREFIMRHELIGRGDRVLLSLSAGKDSMLLLHAIGQLRKELAIDPGIFHLNHMMRGKESDRDEDFVLARGDQLGMETHLCRHDFAASRAPGVSFEEDARDVRYRMLDEIADNHGYTVIATAHSRDDQVETVLMRIMTGTGIHGLQGIMPKRGRIVRPLLDIPAGEIYDYLSENGIEWREDASNEDVSYSRNYIRHRILPCVREKFPMADESLQSLAGVAEESISLIDGLVGEHYPGISRDEGDVVYIDAGALMDRFPLFAHVASSLIRRKFKHNVNRKMLEGIYSNFSIEKSNAGLYADKVIKADKVFRNDKSWLVLRHADHEDRPVPRWIYRIDQEVYGERTIELAEIGLSVTIKAADYAFFEKFHKNNRYIFVTLENNNESLYIRNRREGDCIRTENGTKKIKELFIEKKLDKASKNRVPLLVAGDKVIACMTGFLHDVPNRVAADFLVDKNSKKVVAVFKN